MDTKQHEALIAERAAVVGSLAYSTMKRQGGLFLQVCEEVRTVLDGVEDVAVAQATIDGLIAKGGKAYADLIAKNCGKDRFWLRPSGKAGKASVRPDGFEEARPFTTTSVGQYLRLIKGAIGHGLDRIPMENERHGDWSERVEALEGPSAGKGPEQAGGTPTPAPAPTAVHSKPAEAIAVAADASEGKAEPFLRNFAESAQEAASMERTVEFWQHMAREASTWIAAQRKVQAIIGADADDSATDDEGKPEAAKAA